MNAKPDHSLGNKAHPQSPPINDKDINRLLLIAAIKILKHIRPRHGYVLMLSRRLCVKYGSFRGLAEASSMRFVAKHTSIPVPRVYCAFSRKGRVYILMERIQGEILGQGWVRRTTDSQMHLLSQLKSMVEEMRKLPAPGQAISSVDGGSLFDCRLPGSLMRFGPFADVQDFHRHLRQGFQYDPGNNPEINELIRLQEAASHPPVFTHGDLSSLNILVRDDKIVGIIDWETAGWLPSYWEYTTACFVNPQNEFWQKEIDRFLSPRPKELRMEELRRKFFGDF